MNKPPEITVNTYKYDGRLHRSWNAKLVERKDSLLVLLGVFDSEIIHKQLGVIAPKTLSYEYYWLDRWYNVFRFHEPDGALRNYYCNVNMPPKFEDGVLSYIDLDIDILVSPGFAVEILDLDEFKENKILYDYPGEVVQNALAALDEVKEMIRGKIFPFSRK